MSTCWAFWEAGCVIDWEAWSAIGSLAAVFFAVASTVRIERRAYSEKEAAQKAVLIQIFDEARTIMFTANWCKQLNDQASSGRIPSSFDPPFAVAIIDIKKLNTHIYDLHGHTLPQLPSPLSGVLMGQYRKIKTHLNIISAILSDTKDQPAHKVFHSIYPHIESLLIPSSNIALDLASHLTFEQGSNLDPGPESYTTWPGIN